MTAWSERASDERSLFNPAFGAIVLARTCAGYARQDPLGLPFALSYLILPLALHVETRLALPKTLATQMHAWLDENAALRIGFPERALDLADISRESIDFGLRHRALLINKGCLQTAIKFTKAAEASADVGDCFKSAEFLGGWLARAGDFVTILARWGVRP